MYKQVKGKDQDPGPHPLMARVSRIRTGTFWEATKSTCFDFLFFISFYSLKLKWDFQSSDMFPNAGWLASVHIRGYHLGYWRWPFGAAHHLRSTLIMR